MTLTLRKTVIKGETAHGDYLVLEDGKAIGRIRLGHGLNGAMRWYWNVTVHVLPEQRPVGETWKKPGPHSKRHGKEIVAYVPSRKATRGVGSEGRNRKGLNPMADVTYYVALPFVQDDTGERVEGAAEELQSPIAAIRRAEALSRSPGVIGAVAFSRSGDPALGEFSDAVVLRKFGDVPDDLSGL